ncbi:nucleoside-diphosphate kinase [Chlamydiia bacterium]|nr:nucleoside-diphosphate kinase [Chlamydiia bacterium]
MMTNKTFAIIKPDAVSNGKTGHIISAIESFDFDIVKMKKIHLSNEQAEAFYAVHAERPFYGELVEFMTSGPVVVLSLEKENAVSSFREAIGDTDPANAMEGTIRNQFGENKGKNAIHGSDSDENASIETSFFFGNE